MLTRRTMYAAAALMAIGVWGCSVGGRVAFLEKDHHGHTKLVKFNDHHCDAHCGHYEDNGRVIVTHEHVHGPGCGHHFDGKHWVISGEVDIDE